MTTYLITGGAGFIGSNIVHHLVQNNESVVVLDNLSTGNLSNLEPVLKKIRFIEGDIRDLSTLQQAFKGVDYVLHQAALRAVGRSIDDPVETNGNNITGTLNVLVAARDNQVKRIVYASSSSVYGTIKEEYNVETLVPSPESPYALTKLTGEHYCRIFSHLYGLETVTLRYFNVFGPHQDPESKYSAVIPIFIDNLLRNKAPEIHWDGNQSRDFTFVGNVVQANIKAATTKNLKPGEAYNIGNGENTSINQLLTMLQELLGVSLMPKRSEKRAGDIYRTHASIDKAKRDLGYEPAVSFYEGLKSSIAWYQSHLRKS